MDEDFDEYKCVACKKAVKNIVAQCKTCGKQFFHPGCTSKYKRYDKNRELVSCGPFMKFSIESEIVGETDMKKSVVGSGAGGRMGSALRRDLLNWRDLLYHQWVKVS